MKCAIVGLGGFAKLISSAIKDSNRVRLVAGCDINPERLREFTRESGTERLYDCVENLLADRKSNLSSLPLCRLNTIKSEGLP